MSNFNINDPNPFRNGQTPLNEDNLNAVVNLARQGGQGARGNGILYVTHDVQRNASVTLQNTLLVPNSPTPKVNDVVLAQNGLMGWVTAVQNNSFTVWFRDSLMGPQGMRGLQGPQGIQGPPGAFEHLLGQPNGIATLDEGGRLPLEQLPESLDGGGGNVNMVSNSAITWQITNPVLPVKTFGYETTRGLLKLGNGRDRWNDLPYFVNTSISGYVPPNPYLGLELDSWATIAEVSAAISTGLINPFDSTVCPYSIGDTKTVQIGGESVVFEIWGWNHDKKADGSGTAGITFGMKNLMTAMQRLNPTLTNYGGWELSEFRNIFMPQLLSQLPSDLRSVIAEVVKESQNADGSIAHTPDKLFLFSVWEISGQFSQSQNVGVEGNMYMYWQGILNGASQLDRRKMLAGIGNPVQWWFRSVATDRTTSFARVATTGTIGVSVANMPNGVCFGFCV